MKFGSVDNPGAINYFLPQDHPDTKKILGKQKSKKAFKISVGCAKWNRTDLKNFYPKGTKDELVFYASQFNSIELNATFYGMPKKEQIAEWYNKTPDYFKFFPKITNSISHYRRLINVKELTETYCNIVAGLGEKLGMVFLQMHDNFKTKDIDRVIKFVQEFPAGIPLAMEVRNSAWFQDKQISNDLNQLLLKNKVTNIIVDSAGRRDLLHMRLTSPKAFIRFVGANHQSDYERLDQWIDRIVKWKSEGLKELYFFIHQNVELSSPLLATYFIEKLNEKAGLQLIIPTLIVSKK